MSNPATKPVTIATAPAVPDGSAPASPSVATQVAADLFAEVIELRKVRGELGEALVRVTEERDKALTTAGSVTLSLKRAIAERDAARDEVVRLGRELEQWKQAFGEDGLRVAKARLLDALGRSRRPWTDDEVTVKDDGMRVKTVAVKRACNGCGELLGDVTDEELERAIAGLPAEDVRGECFTCTPLPSPGVSLDALSREVVRLRTIIGELGAAEAAEPPEGQRCPRCGETRELSEKWGVCQPCVIDERWEDVAAAQPPEGIEALRPGGAE